MSDNDLEPGETEVRWFSDGTRYRRAAHRNSRYIRVRRSPSFPNEDSILKKLLVFGGTVPR
jgi:hypothetical protein